MNDHHPSRSVNEADAPLSFGNIGKNWGWLLALGVIYVLLGTIGLGMSAAVTIGTMLMFGILLLVGGGFQFAYMFRESTWKNRLLHLLTAALYIAGGLGLLSNPQAGSMVLTLLLGSVIAAAGVLRIIAGIQWKAAGARAWVIVSGIISLILGIMILMKWPESSLWVIGMFVAIELIVQGWTYVFVAAAARKFNKANG